MHLSIPAGTTSKIIAFPVYDSSSAVGETLAGLVYDTASLTAYYNRTGAAGAATAISLATMTKGTWATGGFVAVDGTNMPGWYELGVPDAALAAGCSQVQIMLKGAANMVPVCIEVELTVFSNQVSAASAAELAIVKGFTGYKKIINAAGTQVKLYSTSGALLVTLDKSVDGSGIVTWTPTEA